MMAGNGSLTELCTCAACQAGHTPKKCNLYNQLRAYLCTEFSHPLNYLHTQND